MQTSAESLGDHPADGEFQTHSVGEVVEFDEALEDFTPPLIGGDTRFGVCGRKDDMPGLGCNIVGSCYRAFFP